MIHLFKAFGELSQNCFTLVDLKQFDQPLIYVNQVFRNLLQYSDDEILGRNCRFLQGPLTEQSHVQNIHNCISSKDLVCQDILNYKKNGATFWNRLVLLPFESEDYFYYIGLQHDISSKMSWINPLPPNTFAQKQIFDKREVSHWIRNRLNVAFMNIQMHDKNKNPASMKRISTALQQISDYVWSLGDAAQQKH